MVFPTVIGPSPKGGYHGVAIVPLPVALAEGMPLAAVVRAGGRRCPWGFWVPVEPGVLPGPVEHRHSSRAVRHRYRLRPRLSTRSRGPGA